MKKSLKQKIKDLDKKIETFEAKIEVLLLKRDSLTDMVKEKCKHIYRFWSYTDDNYDRDYSSGYQCIKCQNEVKTLPINAQTTRS